MTNTTKPAAMYTTLNINPATGWQPCREETGHYAQHKVTGPHTWAVVTDGHDGEKLYMHGAFDQDRARRFAQSMGNGDRSRAVEVAPYWYCEAWGVVPAASVHELDETNAGDWSHRPAAAIVLGSEVA